jgi:hypothetical protein
VALNWADWAAIAVLVAAGCAVTYAAARHALMRAMAERQLSIDRQLSELADAVAALQTTMTELSQLPEIEAAAAPEPEMDPAAPVPDGVVRLDDDEVSAEIMAVIAAAAEAFLGKKARILSAKPLQSPPEMVNAWSQQGRMFVQASHNLRLRS